MPLPLINPRHVSVVLRDYGKKNGAFRFESKFRKFLEARKFMLTKEGRSYSNFVPPPGAHKPFRFNVEIPTREQVEKLARQFHEEGVPTAVMLGDWPAIYRPAHAIKWQSVEIDPFTAKPIGPEQVTESPVPATFRVGYLLFWDAEVTFSNSGVRYNETPSTKTTHEPTSLFDCLDDEPESSEELPGHDLKTLDETVRVFTPTIEDTRKAALRSIKTRQGQQEFRETLRSRYGDQCQISGCGLLDVLEAAHIKPYRGGNDHNPANGLLLRSDLHTLFDLDLIGIEPQTLTVRVHPRAQQEYGQHEGKKLRCIGSEPSKEALSLRWTEYLRKLSG